jgi:hypothetical protein
MLGIQNAESEILDRCFSLETLCINDQHSIVIAVDSSHRRNPDFNCRLPTYLYAFENVSDGVTVP